MQGITSVATSGGKAKVYIKAVTDIKGYKKGDIIAKFNKASFSLNLEDRGKESHGKNLHLSNLDMILSSILIDPHTFSTGMISMFANKNKKETCIVPFSEKVNTDSEGVAFLKYPAIDLVLYDEEYLDTQFLYNQDDDTITAEPNSTFIAEYYVSKEVAAGFDFNRKFLPYVQIEIVNEVSISGTGNSYMYMKIPKASLVSDVSLTYNSGEITRTGLEFNIIENKAEVYFY